MCCSALGSAPPKTVVEGEWNASKLTNAPDGADDTLTYCELTFAQELEVLADSCGCSIFLAGGSDKAKGQNFIFYRISSGQQAPNFQNIEEKSIGFGVFF